MKWLHKLKDNLWDRFSNEQCLQYFGYVAHFILPDNNHDNYQMNSYSNALGNYNIDFPMILSKEHSEDNNIIPPPYE